MNASVIFKLKPRWQLFKQQHPKFLAYFKDLGPRFMVPGTVIEVTVKETDGTVTQTNIELTKDDVELYNMMMKK